MGTLGPQGDRARPLPGRRGRAQKQHAGPAMGGSRQLQPPPGRAAGAAQDQPAPGHSAHGRRPLGWPTAGCGAQGVGWRCQRGGSLWLWALEDGAQNLGAPVLLDVRAMAQQSNRVPGRRATRSRACTQSRGVHGAQGSPGVDRGVVTRDGVRLPQPEVGYRGWDPLLARPPPPGSGVPAPPQAPPLAVVWVDVVCESSGEEDVG